MEKGIVDRIENHIAIVETDNGMKDVPAVDGLREGDCVILDGGNIISIDHEETARRRALIEEKLRKLKKQ